MATPDELDLPHRRSAASALNRLAHALVRHRASTNVLTMIASEAERLAASIELEPQRERRLEFAENVRVRKAIEDGGNPAGTDGAFVDMFDDSPVSGSANPLAIGLKIARFSDHVIGRVTLSPGWQGAPGRSHGGVVAALVDEVLGAMLPVLQVVAFTGELSLRYEASCPMDVPLEFTARQTGADGRKLYLECVGVSDEGTFVTAKATFIQVDLSIFEGEESGT